jgi:hypothetical protein
MNRVRDLILENARPVPALRDFWGHASPARIPGGVLDLTFVATVPSDGTPPVAAPPIVDIPRRRRIVDNRMIVDPIRLR